MHKPRSIHMRALTIGQIHSGKPGLAPRAVLVKGETLSDHFRGVFRSGEVRQICAPFESGISVKNPRMGRRRPYFHWSSGNFELVSWLSLFVLARSPRYCAYSGGGILGPAAAVCADFFGLGLSFVNKPEFALMQNRQLGLVRHVGWLTHYGRRGSGRSHRFPLIAAHFFLFCEVSMPPVHSACISPIFFHFKVR